MTRALQFVLRSGRDTRQNPVIDRRAGLDANNKNNGVNDVDGGLMPEYGAVTERLDSLLNKIDNYDGSDPTGFLREIAPDLAFADASLPSVLPAAQLLRDAFFEECSVLDESPLHRRMRRKPLGYAGDYLLLDGIHTRRVVEQGNARHWDELFHHYPGAQAVRQRAQVFAETCHTLAHELHRPISVLDLGCGSAREVYNALQAEGPLIERLCLVDLDARALEYAQNLIGSLGAQAPVVEAERFNVLRLHVGDGHDLIWAAGLFDYLDDRVVVQLIRRLWRYQRPGGRIVFGNFHPRNPSRAAMELCGKWNLIHRTEVELEAIAQRARVPADCVRVFAEPLGINLFCEIKKELGVVKPQCRSDATLRIPE